MAALPIWIAQSYGEIETVCNRKKTRSTFHRARRWLSDIVSINLHCHNSHVGGVGNVLCSAGGLG